MRWPFCNRVQLWVPGRGKKELVMRRCEALGLLLGALLGALGVRGGASFPPKEAGDRVDVWTCAFTIMLQALSQD